MSNSNAIEKIAAELAGTLLEKKAEGASWLDSPGRNAIVGALVGGAGGAVSGLIPSDDDETPVLRRVARNAILGAAGGGALAGGLTTMMRADTPKQENVEKNPSATKATGSASTSQPSGTKATGSASAPTKPPDPFLIDVPEHIAEQTQTADRSILNNASNNPGLRDLASAATGGWLGYTTVRGAQTRLDPGVRAADGTVSPFVPYSNATPMADTASFAQRAAKLFGISPARAAKIFNMILGAAQGRSKEINALAGRGLWGKTKSIVRGTKIPAEADVSPRAILQKYIDEVPTYVSAGGAAPKPEGWLRRVGSRLRPSSMLGTAADAPITETNIAREGATSLAAMRGRPTGPASEPTSRFGRVGRLGGAVAGLYGGYELSAAPSVKHDASGSFMRTWSTKPLSDLQALAKSLGITESISGDEHQQKNFLLKVIPQTLAEQLAHADPHTPEAMALAVQLYGPLVKG